MWTTVTEDNEYYVIAKIATYFLLNINFCFHNGLCRKKKKKMLCSATILPSFKQVFTIFGYSSFFPPGFSLILQNNILVAHVKLTDRSYYQQEISWTNSALIDSCFCLHWEMEIKGYRQQCKKRSVEECREWDSKGHNHKKKAGWSGTCLIRQNYKRCRENPSICMQMQSNDIIGNTETLWVSTKLESGWIRVLQKDHSGMMSGTSIFCAKQCLRCRILWAGKHDCP